MLTIQRLNMDNTWLIGWNGSRVLLDPWLTGSEIDGGRWFNEQWHATPPVPIDRLPPYDAVVVTQSYNDHCHLDTLAQLDEDVPIFATPKPYRKIRRAILHRDCRLIADFTGPENSGLNGIQFHSLAPKRRLDPIYYALAMTTGEQAIVLAPHGFHLSGSQLSFLRSYRIRLLGTTFSVIELPTLLGGRVNPGLENAKILADQLRPDYIVNTHDEQKHARGIVMRIARTEYPDLGTVRFGGKTTFLNVDHYQPVELRNI